MKERTILMTLLIVLSVASYASAAEGQGDLEHSGAVVSEDKSSMMEHEHKGSMIEHMKEEESSAIEVGNKICPVSGGKVGAMGPAVQHEFKGKIYNFCCAGCVEPFEKDSEKYVKIVEEQMRQHKEMNSEHGHEGHHHVMGEKDAHMKMEKADEEAGTSN